LRRALTAGIDEQDLDEGQRYERQLKDIWTAVASLGDFHRSLTSRTKHWKEQLRSRIYDLKVDFDGTTDLMDEEWRDRYEAFEDELRGRFDKLQTEVGSRFDKLEAQIRGRFGGQYAEGATAAAGHDEVCATSFTDPYYDFHNYCPSLQLEVHSEEGEPPASDGDVTIQVDGVEEGHVCEDGATSDGKEPPDPESGLEDPSSGGLDYTAAAQEH